MAVILRVKDSEARLKGAGPYLHGHYALVVDTNCMGLTRKKDTLNKHEITEVYKSVITAEGPREKSKSMSKGE